MSFELRDRLVVEADASGVARRAAAMIVDAARAAVAARGVFTIALTGGSSPLELYGLLASEPYRAQIDWSRTEVLFGDERAVPPDDRRSNYGSADKVLLSKVPVPDERVHRMEGERVDLDEAAREYEDEVRGVVPGAMAGGVPVIDVILLGVGGDGHIFSLFPGCPDITEPRGVIVALHDPPMNPAVSRLTMSPLVLDVARAVIVLAFGAGKASALHALLDGPRDPSHTPAQLVARAGERVTILADPAAIAQLDAPPG